MYQASSKTTKSGRNELPSSLSCKTYLPSSSPLRSHPLTLHSPAYHAYGQTYYGLNYPRMGVPIYLMKKYDFITMLQWIERYKITNLTLVPPIVVQLAKRSETKDYDLSTIEGVGCGAAPLGKEVTEEFQRKFGAEVSIRQGWVSPTSPSPLFPKLSMQAQANDSPGHDRSNLLSRNLGSQH